MAETFEQYTNRKSYPHLTNYTHIIETFGVVGYLQTMIPDIHIKSVMNPIDTYDFILINCQYLYKLAPETQGLKELLVGLYEIDTVVSDCDSFSQIFNRNRARITNPVMLEIHEQFCRLIFKFNGYQAPPRSNPRDAYRDALGDTNLFEELIKN